MLLQLSEAVPPAKSTTPPFALNVPPVTVKAPFVIIVPAGAVKVPPVLSKNEPFVMNVVKLLASNAPATVRTSPAVRDVIVPKLPPFTVSALGFTVVNPERDEPVLRVKVPVVKVTAPVPLSVPLRVMELGIVGLLPRGREQLLPTVLVPV